MTRPSLSFTAGGRVSLTRSDGRPASLAECERSLRRVADAALAGGADPADLELVTLFAGIVKALAHQQQRIDVLMSQARGRAHADAALDIVNMKRGPGRAKRDQVHALAGQLAGKFRSKRSLWAAIRRQTGLTLAQVRQILDPPKRSKR